MTSGAELLGAVRPVLSSTGAKRIGVAVSGGGDSLALLLLLHEWAGAHGAALRAVTVDHGLRAESAEEAAGVGEHCAQISVPHDILRWENRDSRGNLQAQARDARRSLIGQWAREHEIDAVALGHTLDDQAETLLMRLARGSGVDGLAAMQPVSQAHGLTWIRPLLDLRRAGLRRYLEQRGVAWVEDPSNEDNRFDRVRVRRALEVLEPLGIEPQRLATTARNMQRARYALETVAEQLLQECVACGRAGDARIDVGIYAGADAEIQLRVLSAVLCWVSGEPYRPRLNQLEALNAAILGGTIGNGTTLHGCILRSSNTGQVVVRRELSCVSPPVPASLGEWDGRWQATDVIAFPKDAKIGALGAGGLAQIADWRETGLDREVLITTPALWVGEELKAAPLAEMANSTKFCLISSRPRVRTASLLR